MTITTIDKAYAIANLIKVHGIDKRPYVDADANIHYSRHIGYRREVVRVGRPSARRFVPEFKQCVITYDTVIGIYFDLYEE